MQQKEDAWAPGSQEATLEQDLGAERKSKGIAEGVMACAEAGGQGTQASVFQIRRTAAFPGAMGFREGVLGNQLGKGH